MQRQIEIWLLTTMLLSGALAHAQQSVAPVKASAQSATTLPANSEPLEIKLVRSKVVLVDGREVLQDATLAKPGEILEEVATYTNKSRTILKRVEATLPVPANTVLLIESIRPGNAKASIDGRCFSVPPLKRKVKQANGVEIEQTIAADEYRYLRWYPGDLAAGKSLAFSARFKVSDDNGLAAFQTGK